MNWVSATADVIPTEIMQEYCEAFARGQWGLIFTEGTYINESESQDFMNRPSIANHKYVSEWSKIVDIIIMAEKQLHLLLLAKWKNVIPLFWERRVLSSKRNY